MILETRKYAYRNIKNIRNMDNDGSEKNKNENNENENENNCDTKKEKKSDENIDGSKADDNARTDYVMCTYHSTILELREEASKYGLRRACVLLGENGTYECTFLFFFLCFTHSTVVHFHENHIHNYFTSNESYSI